MESTSRGLELTRTGQLSDAQRLRMVMETAINAKLEELHHEIDRSNTGGLTGYIGQIAATAEVWDWASDVYYDRGDTPTVLIAVPKYARHIDEWHEDMGPVLWWRDPIEEPPYVGTPLDTYFDDSYLWWSPIDIPEIPESETQE